MAKKKEDAWHSTRNELTPEEEKFGVVLEEYMIELNEDKPIKVSIVEQRDSWWLDTRRMYRKKDDSLGYGKGLRINIDDGEFEDYYILLNSIIARIEFEDEDEE